MTSENTGTLSITTPFNDEMIRSLRAGQMIELSGHVYTARDAAHKKLVTMIKDGEPTPFDFFGQVVYYAGPCPAKPGYAIGSVGPTTSGRMDLYSPYLIEKGLKVMIGKGLRSQEVIESIKKLNGVYFAAIGGAAALMAKCVTKAEVIAFDELGTEAIRKLTIHKLPLITAIDCYGNCAYK